MEWFRWYVGSSLDPKFRVVAQRSTQKTASVLAVWAMLLERASAEEDRGSFLGFDCESVDAALELEAGATKSILEQMKQRGLLACGRIANWRKRQPLREDQTAVFRKQAQRAREKEQHTASRNVTTEEKRKEKKLEEKKRKDIKAEEKQEKKANNPVLNNAYYQQSERAETQALAGCSVRSHSLSSKRSRQPENEIQTSQYASGQVSQYASGQVSQYASGQVSQYVSGQVLLGELVNEEGGNVPRISTSPGISDSLGVSDSPGISESPGVLVRDEDKEFIALREVYSRVARREEQYKGYAEYCQLHEASDWPGLETLCRAVASFAEKDKKWQQGYAPGLPRFLREKWWQRQPEQARLLSYAQAQDAERRQRAMRLLEHHSSS